MSYRGLGERMKALMRRAIGVLILCIVPHVVHADWFDKIKISGGLGGEYFYCYDNSCGDYDIGNGIIGKFSLWQSVYSSGGFDLEVGWDHFSDIETDTRETPIDYFGVEISYEIDL